MHARTQPVAIQPLPDEAQREAPFASTVQLSDTPTAELIAGAITSAMRRFGAATGSPALHRSAQLRAQGASVTAAAE
jgi:hypothetical protein